MYRGSIFKHLDEQFLSHVLNWFSTIRVFLLYSTVKWRFAQLYIFRNCFGMIVLYFYTLKND
jgi:hypothetical protein